MNTCSRSLRFQWNFPEIQKHSFTKEVSSEDVFRMKVAGSGLFLSKRWSVSPGLCPGCWQTGKLTAQSGETVKGKNKVITISSRQPMLTHRMKMLARKGTV